MANVVISVWMHGRLVEYQALTLRRSITVGGADNARVSFPGPTVVLTRVDNRVLVGSQCLEPGDDWIFEQGVVRVRIENSFPLQAAKEWRNKTDHRFLVAAVMLLCVGTWFDSVQKYFSHAAWGTHSSFGLHGTELETETRSANLGLSNERHDAQWVPTEVGLSTIAVGPAHESDDHVSGVAWYSWYRQAVPEEDGAGEAYLSFLDDPLDAGARRVLALSAYNADNPSVSLWHYRWLVKQYPRDLDLRIRLAWAEKRRGRHNLEVEQYRAVLAIEPEHRLAQAGLAVALARLNRLDEASLIMDELQGGAPMFPYTDVTIGLVEAIQGHDKAAMVALNRGFEARRQLSEELQLELRRDLALDPILQSLRSDKRLNNLVHRHLGAAGPQPMR